MDCDTSVHSIWNNTNRNIRRKQQKKKLQKKITGKMWQLVPEWAASQTTASLGRDGMSEDKQPNWNLTAWIRGGGVRRQQVSSPSAKPLALYIIFLSTRYMANATITTNTEVKHKRQASVSRSKQSALTLKTLLKRKSSPPHQLSGIASQIIHKHFSWYCLFKKRVETFL